MNRDPADIVGIDACLVGDGADDVAGLHAVLMPDFETKQLVVRVDLPAPGLPTLPGFPGLAKLSRLAATAIEAPVFAGLLCVV